MKEFLKNRSQPFARVWEEFLLTTVQKKINQETLSWIFYPPKKKTKLVGRSENLQTVIQSESTNARRRHNRSTEGQGGWWLVTKRDG